MDLFASFFPNYEKPDPKTAAELKILKAEANAAAAEKRVANEAAAAVAKAAANADAEEINRRALDYYKQKATETTQKRKEAEREAAALQAESKKEAFNQQLITQIVELREAILKPYKIILEYDYKSSKIYNLLQELQNNNNLQNIEYICNEIKINHKNINIKSYCLYLNNALKKHKPENFKFQIICICFDEDCNRYEGEYMKKYNTLVPNGYNLREAGNHGHQNEETKQKIKHSLKLHYSKYTDEQKKKYGEKYLGIKNPNFGKKMSDEQKKRMSISIKTKKKVSCYSLENQFIATYESITSAAREIKGSHRHIQKCCKGKNKTAYGLIWKYL